MSQTPLFRYSHRERDNVLVQDLTDWDGDTEGMDRVESDWVERAEQPHVTAAVTEFGPGVDLGRETQGHLAAEWSANADRVGIERIAFVSDGIKARAVSATLDVAQEVRTFNDREAAVEWARE